MLLEQLTYADDLPMNITVANITEDPLHYHLDIEIACVLRGSVQLKNGYRHYTLREGDIFTNSGHEVHGITALSEDNVVALIQISTHYYSQFFPNLSKACYRTYSRKPGDKKNVRLRELLLQILLKYTTREFNYKSKCIYLMMDTIKHLNKYFNLFAFDHEVVVAFEKSNLVAVERISRICQYIYQYYADNITLEDLSAIEHLNTYYLSHIIKSFTGMSFREFLCFARVEWSEIMLLDSDAKISRVAREVGFSTTAYYKKYFEKWFGLPPEEHRARYLPRVKSDLRPAVMEPLPLDRAAALIRLAYTNYNLQYRDGDMISSISLEVEVNVAAAALGRFEKTLTVIVTPDDYRALGPQLPTLLKSLSPCRVLLLQQPEDRPEELAAILRLLRGEGRTVKKLTETDCVRSISAACDSILYPIHLFRCCLESESGQMEVFLRDTDIAGKLLQGQSALVTANGICKPSYYFHLAAAHTQGSIICRSNQYCVIREEHAGQTVLKLFVYNADKELLDLCRTNSSPEQVKNAINDFQRAIDVDMSIRLPPGQYAVAKYSMSREDNIFGYMANMGFPDNTAVLPGDCPELYSSAPTLEIYPDDVRTILNIHFSIKGVGAQMAVIKPIQQNSFR